MLANGQRYQYALRRNANGPKKGPCHSTQKLPLPRTEAGLCVTQRDQLGRVTLKTGALTGRYQ
jgi:hypothetical protein